MIESACHIGGASHLFGDDMEFVDGLPAEVFQRHLYVPGTDSPLSPPIVIVLRSALDRGWRRAMGDVVAVELRSRRIRQERRRSPLRTA